MTILKNLLTPGEPLPQSNATRVSTKMSDEEREQELARLREESSQVRTKEEEAHYQRRLQSMRSRGIPIRLISKADWEERKARIQQRHLVA